MTRLNNLCVAAAVGFMGMVVGVAGDTLAFDVPGVKVDKPRAPSSVEEAERDLVSMERDRMKQCCNEVRYSSSNIVRPKDAVARLDKCAKGYKSQVHQDQHGLHKVYWRDGLGTSCITVALACNLNSTSSTGDVCTSCSVIPESKISCAP